MGWDDAGPPGLGQGPPGLAPGIPAQDWTAETDLAQAAADAQTRIFGQVGPAHLSSAAAPEASVPLLPGQTCKARPAVPAPAAAPPEDDEVAILEQELAQQSLALELAQQELEQQLQQEQGIMPTVAKTSAPPLLPATPKGPKSVLRPKAAAMVEAPITQGAVIGATTSKAPSPAQYHGSIYGEDPRAPDPLGELLPREAPMQGAAAKSRGLVNGAIPPQPPSSSTFSSDGVPAMFPPPPKAASLLPPLPPLPGTAAVPHMPPPPGPPPIAATRPPFQAAPTAARTVPAGPFATVPAPPPVFAPPPPPVYGNDQASVDEDIPTQITRLVHTLHLDHECEIALYEQPVEVQRLIIKKICTLGKEQNASAMVMSWCAMGEDIFWEDVPSSSPATSMWPSQDRALVGEDSAKASTQSSSWFSEKLEQWQRDLQAWQASVISWRDPKKRALAAKEKESAEMSDASPKADSMEVDDPVLALEQELLKEEARIFDAPDVCDIGDAKPLFSDFAFEQWALLALRFEIHLLVHAVKRDSKTGTLGASQVAFYYNKYYSKMLNPLNYGFQRIDEVLSLIDDTVVTVDSLVESQLTNELHSNDIFVRLTEEDRQVRQRRIDSGDTSAILRLQNRPETISATAPPPHQPPPPPLPGPLRLAPVVGGPPPGGVGLQQVVRGPMPQTGPVVVWPKQGMGKGTGELPSVPYGAALSGMKGSSKSNPYPEWQSYPNSSNWEAGAGQWS